MSVVQARTVMISVCLPGPSAEGSAGTTCPSPLLEPLITTFCTDATAPLRLILMYKVPLIVPDTVPVTICVAGLPALALPAEKVRTEGDTEKEAGGGGGGVSLPPPPPQAERDAAETHSSSARTTSGRVAMTGLYGCWNR